MSSPETIQRHSHTVVDSILTTVKHWTELGLPEFPKFTRLLFTNMSRINTSKYDKISKVLEMP